MTKKYLDVNHKLTSIDDAEFEGSIDTIIDTLQSLKEDFKDKNYNYLWLDKETSYGYYNDMDVSYTLYGSRKETDKEYDARMAKNKKALNVVKINKQKKLEKERKEYERLKKKFEGK